MLNIVKNLMEEDTKLILIFGKIVITIIVVFSLVYLCLSASQVSAAYGLSTKIKQVKTANSPTVYYLDHKRGLKKAYVNAASFLAYGNKWSDIKIISQQQLDKWPEMHIVKAVGSQAVYYIGSVKKAFIKSAEELFSLGFGWEDLVNIAKADLANYQLADLAEIKDTNANTSGSDNITTEAQLQVKLDNSNPKEDYLPLNTTHNLLAVYSFKSLNQTALIKSLAFTFNGVYQVDAVNKIYLVNQDDYVYDIPGSLVNRHAIFNFASQPLVIEPGQELKLKIYLDIGNYQNAIANYIRVSLDKAENIETNIKITGIFPIAANVFKFAAGDVLGQVRVDELSIANNDALIGSTNKIIAKFEIAETSGKEDIIVKQIKLINNGSAADTDLKNFKLTDDFNATVAQTSLAAQSSIIFNLNDYKISKNSDRTFLVLADVTGGENHKINLNWSDALILGKDYNYGLNFSFNNLNQEINIIRQPLAVVAKSLKLNDKVFIKQSGVIIGNFQIRNNDKSIILRSIDVSLLKNNGAPDLNHDITLVNYATGEVYNSANAATLSSRSLNLSFNNLSMQPKQELTFSLIADISDNVRDGDNYKIVVNKINYQDSSYLIFQDDVGTIGETLVASKSSLFIYPNNNEKSQTFTKGQKNIKIASFILEAAAGDDVIISNLTLAKSSQTSGSLLYENGFNNLKVYLGFSPSKNTLDRPFGTTYFFDGYNFTLAAGSRVEMKVYVDTIKDLKASEIQLSFINLAAISRKSGIPTVISGFNTDSFKTFFVKASIELKQLNGGTVTSGTKNNTVATFSIKNSGGEDIRLNKINIVTSSDGFSYSLGYSNLTVWDKTKNINLGTIYNPVAGANQINLWSYYVINPGQEVTLTVTVDAANSVTSNSFNIYFSQLGAYGKTSNIAADVSGDPTDSVQVIVSGAGNNN